jgi:mannose PTS system EIIA component
MRVRMLFLALTLHAMIGILIVAHGSLADSLVECATHVLGQPSAWPRHAGFHRPCRSRRTAEGPCRRRLAELDEGDGILVLTDVYGATPSNVLCRLLEPAHIEGVSGVNLPMLHQGTELSRHPGAAATHRAHRRGGAQQHQPYLRDHVPCSNGTLKSSTSSGLHARPSASTDAAGVQFQEPGVHVAQRPSRQRQEHHGRDDAGCRQAAAPSHWKRRAKMKWKRSKR